MKSAVIDVGGGLRGAYAAGVLDYCLDHDIAFDINIGISAGAANLASYVAGQKGRNYFFYTEYAMRPEYMSLDHYKQTGSYIDLDYIYSTLSNEGGENPADFDALQKSDQDLYVVATNAITGEPVYFTKEDIERNNFDILKASSSIPVVNQPYLIKNVPFFDGAVSDPIPVNKAIELGAEKIVIILTKPSDKPRTGYKDEAVTLFMKDYPEARDKLKTRITRYNKIVEKLKELEKEGQILLVAPDDTEGVDTLSRDIDKIDHLYRKGYEDGKRIEDFLKRGAEEQNTNPVKPIAPIELMDSLLLEEQEIENEAEADLERMIQDKEEEVENTQQTPDQDQLKQILKEFDS